MKVEETFHQETDYSYLSYSSSFEILKSAGIAKISIYFDPNDPITESKEYHELRKAINNLCDKASQ